MSMAIPSTLWLELNESQYPSEAAAPGTVGDLPQILKEILPVKHLICGSLEEPNQIVGLPMLQPHNRPRITFRIEPLGSRG
jgi:hypothetical protein